VPFQVELEAAQAASFDSSELQRMLDEVGVHVGCACSGWVVAGESYTLHHHPNVPSPLRSTSRCLPYRLAAPARPHFALPCPPCSRWRSSQVNQSLSIEREARQAAYLEKALVQIQLEAKQRLADMMKQVGWGWG